MKLSIRTVLAATLFSCLTTLTAHADLIWYESFNYADGAITNATGIWIKHSGTANPSDALVKSHKLEVAATSPPAPNPLSRQDDVHRFFSVTNGSIYTNSAQQVFASFTINCTNFPNAAGQYFAHFYKDTSTFHARIFGLTGSGGPGNAPTNFAALKNTYRLGISGAAPGPNAVFPVDLATNVDYQVVVSWDPGNTLNAFLWINPVSSSDLAVKATDVTALQAAELGYGFRQASSAGNSFYAISNVAVATTWDEAATNVWSSNPTAPIIAYQPPAGQTNFVGDPAFISAVAAGQGLSSLTYQWRKDGTNITNPGGNTNVFAIASAATSDSGNYDLVASNIYGLSVTSSVSLLWVTNPPIPPTITSQPTNVTVYFGQTASLYSPATGPGTITYTWYYNNNPALGLPNVTGADGPALSVSNVQTNNGTTGIYYCAVSNEFGGVLSSNAVLSAIPVPTTNIAYLRTLVDPVFYLPTNTTAFWSASGVVTVSADMTGTPNLSFVMQDATAGIGVFMSGGAANLPALGDNITVTGPLSAFNGLLQFNLSASDPSTTIVTNSHNNPIPAGKVLPFSFTNGVAYGGLSNVMEHFVSSYITFTNVYFAAADGTNTFAAGGTYVMTNASGGTMRMFLNAAMHGLDGMLVPQFAYTVSGPMGYFVGSPTDTNRAAGFELDPTSTNEVVVVAPPAVTATVEVSNQNAVLNWIAQPFMSYSILSSSDVRGPYLPLASGLTFNTTLGQFIDPNPLGSNLFYRITSP